MNTIKTLDYLAIITYFLLIMGVGIYGAHRAKDREEYLVAGRNLNFPMFFGCIAAMSVGGAVTIGGAAKGYSIGLSGWWIGGALGFGFIFLGMLVSSKLNRLRSLSITEVIAKHYGTSARILSVLLTVIYTAVLSVVQVIAMGSILSSIFEIDIFFGCLYSGSVVVIYTFIGGMWSVSMTDIVQFIIKTIGVIILIPPFVLMSSKVGGLSGIINNVPSSFWNLGELGFSGSLYWILLYIPGLAIGQDIWQRVFTAKNDHIARQGTIAAGFYSILYGFTAVLLGIGVKAAGIELNNPQESFSTGVITFLPQGLCGLLLAAALAASMSVASGTILACSTVIYNELTPLLKKSTLYYKEKPESYEVWINRILVLLVGIVILLLSVTIKDIFTALDISYTYLSGCLFIPVIVIFILKKVNHLAGLVSLAVSALTVTISMIAGHTGLIASYLGKRTATYWDIGGPYPILVGLISSLLSFLLVNTIMNKIEASR